MLLGVDVGGTFTDAVLVGADGAVHTAKVPSTPAEQSLAVLDAVARGARRARARAPSDVERFAHGMTVATNALLEGRTARTALIATAGFTDVIELGRQARPHLYRLCEAAPAPLVPAELRFAAPERMTPDGVATRARPPGGPRARAGAGARRPAGRRGGAASLLRPPPTRAPARRARWPSCLPRRPPVALAAISSARSASTSGRPPPFSTPPSRHCSAPTCAALERRARERPARAADHAVLGRAHRRRPRRPRTPR